MKKVLSLLFAMLLCISLAACGEKISTQDGAGVETDDKGRPVKNTYYDASGNVTSVETIEYNEQGQRHLVITYDAQNTEIKRVTYTYFSDGFVHTEETIVANPLPGDDTVRTMLEYGEDRTWWRILSYDAAGQLVQEQYDEFDVYSRMIHYKDGKFETCFDTTYNEDGTWLDRQLREDGSVMQESLYKTDEEENPICIKSTEYREDGGIWTVTEWDAEEEMNKITQYDEDGAVYEIWWSKGLSDAKKLWLPLENGEYVKCEVPDPEYSLRGIHTGAEGIITSVGYEMMDAQGNIIKSMEFNRKNGVPEYCNEWDSNGVLTKGVEYFEDGKISREFSCNEAGKIHETVIYNRSGEVVLIYNCKGTDKYISSGYDNLKQEEIIWLLEGDNVTLEELWFRNGIITQKHLFTAGKCTGMILYDAVGQAYMEVSVMGDPQTHYLSDIIRTEDGGFYYLYERDENGNNIGYFRYDIQGQLVISYLAKNSATVNLSGWEEDGVFIFRGWDANGDVTEDYRVNLGNNPAYEYDENGKLLRYTCFREDGSAEWMQDYDGEGNVTGYTQYDTDGNVAVEYHCSSGEAYITVGYGMSGEVLIDIYDAQDNLLDTKEFQI